MKQIGVSDDSRCIQQHDLCSQSKKITSILYTFDGPQILKSGEAELCNIAIRSLIMPRTLRRSGLVNPL